MRLHRSVPGIIALAITAPAQAGTTSGTIAVSLTVEPTCHVTARPMPFVWRAGFPSHAQSDVRIRCSSDTQVTVAIDDGRNATGGSRMMRDGQGRLVPYAIYADAARTRAWRSDALAVDGAVSAGRALDLVAYGEVGGGPAIEPGEYRDTLTVTVTF